MNPQPSADALNLARVIWPTGRPNVSYCWPTQEQNDASRLEDWTWLANVIDRELQLPQRNAALLLAQGVADVAKHATEPSLQDAIADLRDALAAIKTR